MPNIKTLLSLLVFSLLLLTTSYQTYALMELNAQLDASGISLGNAKANYNFSSGAKSLGELPDMAGGC